MQSSRRLCHIKTRMLTHQGSIESFRYNNCFIICNFPNGCHSARHSCHLECSTYMQTFFCQLRIGIDGCLTSRQVSKLAVGHFHPHEPTNTQWLGTPVSKKQCLPKRVLRIRYTVTCEVCDRADGQMLKSHLPIQIWGLHGCTFDDWCKNILDC